MILGIKLNKKGKEFISRVIKSKSLVKKFNSGEITKEQLQENGVKILNRLK